MEDKYHASPSSQTPNTARRRAKMAVSYRLASDRFTHDSAELEKSADRLRASAGEDREVMEYARPIYEDETEITSRYLQPSINRSVRNIGNTRDTRNTGSARDIRGSRNTDNGRNDGKLVASGYMQSNSADEVKTSSSYARSAYADRANEASPYARSAPAKRTNETSPYARPESERRRQADARQASARSVSEGQRRTAARPSDNEPRRRNGARSNASRSDVTRNDVVRSSNAAVRSNAIRSNADFTFAEPINHEQERIREWLKQVRFKKNIMGGVNEADVWKKISELNALYEAALSAERARYDAMLAERIGSDRQNDVEY